MGGRFKKETTYVYLWLIHVDIWQKPTQYCKAIIFQLKINKYTKKKTVYLYEKKNPKLQNKTKNPKLLQCLKALTVRQERPSFHSKRVLVIWTRRVRTLEDRSGSQRMCQPIC